MTASIWGRRKEGHLLDCLQGSRDPDRHAHAQGHVYSSETGKLERYYKPVWAEPGYHPTTPLDLTAIRVSLCTRAICLASEFQHRCMPASKAQIVMQITCLQCSCRCLIGGHCNALGKHVLLPAMHMRGPSCKAGNQWKCGFCAAVQRWQCRQCRTSKTGSWQWCSSLLFCAALDICHEISRVHVSLKIDASHASGLVGCTHFICTCVVLSRLMVSPDCSWHSSFLTSVLRLRGHEAIGVGMKQSMQGLAFGFSIVAGFNRVFRNLAAAPCQKPDAEGALAPAFVRCITGCTGKLMECRGLAPAEIQLAGAEDSALGI